MIIKRYSIILTISLFILIFGCGQDNRINNNVEPPEIIGVISAPDTVSSKIFFIASIAVEDPQGLDVQARFDWGNGFYSEYTDFAPSGSVLEMPYSYSNSGNFTISVTVRNRAGMISTSNEHNHFITVLYKPTSNLIDDLLIHNNRLFMTTNSPVNLNFQYQRAGQSGTKYFGYSATNKRSYLDFPLIVESSGLDYELTLQVETETTVKDTILTFVSTSSQYPLLRVDFVDVRQGDGALIQTPEGQAIAIDGGYGSRVPGFSQPAYWNGAGHPFMLNYVINENITRFRFLIESHNHMDHWGGLADIIDAGIPYDYYLSPDTPLDYTVGSYLNISSSVRFRILNIDIPPGLNTTNENNRSIVLRVEYGEIAYLFTGDMEAVLENYLVNEGFNLSADVLKVAHHGSQTSSRQYFLEAVFNRYAQIAVMSFGTGNPYNHPHSLDRFSDYEVFGTGQPSNPYQGDNYHFNTGDVQTYSDGYIIIVSY
ncbi:MAG: MBL fold metallo-hydrolase [Candidatus Cloacimonetes bacterium]|nr:MBL fold metallo-hydrolase [Candidatus Cloacimonadota bacterium]